MTDMNPLDRENDRDLENEIELNQQPLATRYRVRYAIHTSMATDDFVSGGEYTTVASNVAEAEDKTRAWVEANNPHHDPRIDPFIEIQDGWCEEIEES